MAGDHLYCADNLEVLRHQLEPASVDLIYLDPPFKSQQRYRLGRAAESGPEAFDDVWRWDQVAETTWLCMRAELPEPVGVGLEGLRSLLGPTPMLAYLTAMAGRLVALRAVLRDNGSIYLHCDGAASHYLKVLMDCVFGASTFLNNIVWLYGLGGSSPRYWPRKHDDILWYARVPDGHFFEPAMVPATSQRMRGQQKKAPDYWSIPTLNNMARERLGYPTQKPEALLERIIGSSSRSGDVVLDPCCGSGTTLVVAERLGRRWIGIDNSPAAIDLCRRRLEQLRSPQRMANPPRQQGSFSTGR